MKIVYPEQSNHFEMIYAVSGPGRLLKYIQSCESHRPSLLLSIDKHVLVLTIAVILLV
jgi:hypothetical protein